MATDWINDVFDNEKQDDWFNELLNVEDQKTSTSDLDYFDFGYYLCQSQIGIPITTQLKDVSFWPDPIEANENRLAIWNATSTKLISEELNSTLKQQVEELLSFKNTKYLKRNSLSADIHQSTTIYDVVNPFANGKYIVPYIVPSFNYIPTIFYCKKDNHTKQWNVSIQSEINDLPKVYFKNLYRTIQQIFSKFVPLFIDVLSMLDMSPDYSRSAADREQTETRRKQLPGKSEYEFKVITKIQIYELNKHSIYEGKYHIEGGNVYNIGAVGLYYFHISDNVMGGELKICRSNKFKQRANYPIVESKIDIKDEQCLVFSNRVLTHKVGQMQLKLNDNVKNINAVGYRKFISFFVVDPALDVENIKCTDEIIVNIRSKVLYIISYWRREHCLNKQIANSLCMLLEAFVCGDMDYNKQMIDQTRAMFLKDNFMQTNRVPMAD
eukprot:200835_1